MSELVSTRDPSAAPVSYREAILTKAPDGGLFMPEGADYPTLDSDELSRLAGFKYEELAGYVKAKLVGGAIAVKEQVQIASSAYDPAAFPAAADGNLAPVEAIAGNLYWQNLSLGPTAAFKDFGLRSLARDINHVLQEEDRQLDLLGATSGDTGSAAEHAIKDLSRMRLIMLSPEEGMSDFQQAQMGELSGGNILNISVRGRFDDCQRLVKDRAFRDYGAVNSINWGRIVAQVPYYVSAYLQLMGDRIGQEVDFVIPTGNFGNVLSGHIARRMGVPIRDLIAATNENDVVHHLIQTGQYVKPAGPAHITSSPSMDITVASNYERLVYELLDGNPTTTSHYMNEFESQGQVDLADYGFNDTVFRDMGIHSGSSTHADRLDSINWVMYQTDGATIIDPHTADAITVARQRELDVPTVCLGTAAPVKFEDTVRQAVGFVPKRNARFEGLEERYSPDNFVVIRPSVQALRNAIRKHLD